MPPATPVTVVFNIFASDYESHEAAPILEHGEAHAVADV